MHLFAMYVAVLYFVFLICIMVVSVVVTIVVKHIYLRSASKPFTPIPTWVSRDSCVLCSSSINTVKSLL